MKKIIFFFCAFAFAIQTKAQELYVFSNPASNMPAHALSVKLTSLIGKERHHFDGRGQRYIPEIMFGLTRDFMLHAGTSFSNMYSNQTRWESMYLYGQYRMYSNDEVHRHFRMAAFAEGAYSRNEPYFSEVSLQGDRSGLQGGIIATQLVHKFAASASASFIQAFKKNTAIPSQAFNYSFSTGLLVLPFEYTSYDQLNMNIYAEILGQQTLDKTSHFIDLAPSVQLIFKSNSKLNLGYRFQLQGNQLRSMKETFLVSFEHSFFNALKK